MRVLIITSCTARKADTPLPAGEFYFGEQHRRLMLGIKAFRERGGSVDLYIISAEYGMMWGGRSVEPYNRSFVGMSKKEIRERGIGLGIPRQFSILMRSEVDATLILLGDDYLEACCISPAMTFASPTYVFCGRKAAGKFPSIVNQRNLHFQIVSNALAKEIGCGMVGLKGELAKRFLDNL